MLLVEAERMKRKIELLSEERAKLYDELQRCKVENKELLEVNKQLVEKIKTKKK
jgi:shikimate kinase